MMQSLPDGCLSSICVHRVSMPGCRCCGASGHTKVSGQKKPEEKGEGIWNEGVIQNQRLSVGHTESKSVSRSFFSLNFLHNSNNASRGHSAVANA